MEPMIRRNPVTGIYETVEVNEQEENVAANKNNVQPAVKSVQCNKTTSTPRGST